MNLRFLETFVLLAELRNFRLTAERLYTTQAAVSSRIATLEQEFGVRLFDRGVREVTLTADGAKALVHAERMLRLMRERSEEHTSELQSRQYLVCRLLLEKKKNIYNQHIIDHLC